MLQHPLRRGIGFLCSSPLFRAPCTVLNHRLFFFLFEKCLKVLVYIVGREPRWDEGGTPSLFLPYSLTCIWECSENWVKKRRSRRERQYLGWLRTSITCWLLRTLWTSHRQKGKRRKEEEGRLDRLEQDEKEFNFKSDIYDDCRRMECIL